MAKIIQLQRLVLVRDGDRDNGGNADTESLDRGRFAAEAVQKILETYGSSYTLVHTAPQTVAQQIARLFGHGATVVSALRNTDRDDDGKDLAHAVLKAQKDIASHHSACDTLVMVMDNDLLEAVLKALLRTFQVSDPPDRTRLAGGETYILFLTEPVLRIKEVLCKAPAVEADEIRV